MVKLKNEREVLFQVLLLDDVKFEDFEIARCMQSYVLLF